MKSFDEYLTKPKSLTFEEMVSLHNDLLDEVGDDEEAVELYNELLSTAITYIPFRANWPLWSREEKNEKGEGRTINHDALIIKFNQLARYLKTQGKSAAWRDTLGYEEDDPNYRKRIGDFGCYIVFATAVDSR